MVVLPRVDPYLENKENYVKLDSLWVANLVDIINAAMTEIESSLASIDARLIAGGL